MKIISIEEITEQAKNKKQTSIERLGNKYVNSLESYINDFQFGTRYCRVFKITRIQKSTGLTEEITAEIGTGNYGNSMDRSTRADLFMGDGDEHKILDFLNKFKKELQDGMSIEEVLALDTENILGREGEIKIIKPTFIKNMVKRLKRSFY